MDPIVQEYYELVKRYCSFVEGLVIYSTEKNR